MPNEKHVVKTGDTFESLSTRYFGEPSQSGRIQRANPGTSLILVPGTTVTIPAEPGTAAGTETSGLVMRIDGVSFKNIETITITRRVDSMDTVEITAPLAETEQFRDLVTPLSFRDLEVADSGELLFRGTMTDVMPELTTEGSQVKISGYSRPGVLNDCMMPASAYPIQFRNLNLTDIATKLCEPFSISVKVEGDVGGAFKRVKLKRNKKIFAFLAELAKQRQILLRSNTQGELVLAAPPAVESPVADLKQDRAPVLKIAPQFNPQGYYSHVTGVRSVRRGNKGSQHTVVNPLASGIVRPMAMSMRDTSNGELPKATTALMGRMLGNAVTYTVEVATWRDPQGAPWEPGTTIQLEAPSVFVQRPYQFQIHTVAMARSPKGGDVAKLLLMLPAAFGGEPPSMLPWTT